MSRESARARGRAAAEIGMTDACTAQRKNGPPVYDDATGNTTQPYTALYAGPCRMKQPSAQASNSQVGEAQVLLQSPELHLPMSADLLRPADEVTITASVGDPLSVGRVFIVHAVPAYSNATARRYSVLERTS